MVPTLAGRIQTRIAVLAVGERYEASFLVLGVVIALGVGWEFLYHGLQQFRWEKDWPALFGLVTGVPEGVVVWLVLRDVIPVGVAKPDGLSYVIAFTTVWLVVWMWVNGPMRVPLIHWRFRGGRIV